MKPTLHQTVVAMLALAAEQQPGRDIGIDLGALDEGEMRAFVAESGMSTDVQPSGQIVGGVLESLDWCHSRVRVMGHCTRPVRPGDLERMR